MPPDSSIAESAKQRALRVPLDYYRRADPIVRVKLWLSLVTAVIGGGYLAWLLASGSAGRRHASPGPLAAAHATWDSDCQQCHRDFHPLRPDAVDLAALVGSAAASREAKEAACITCHAAPPHHATAKAEDVATCAACHRDHQGLTANIARPADRMCTACHASIDLHRSGPSALDPPLSHVTAFGPPPAAGPPPHPPFRSLRSDPGNIKFNHWLHLQPGIAVADARQKLRLSDLDESLRSRYATFQQDGLIQLDCTACHQPAAGGGHMQPIAYEQHCRACHPLELRLTAGDVSPMKIPHGLSLTQLRITLDGLYLNHWMQSKPISPGTPDESGSLPLVPGKTIGSNLAQKIGEDFGTRRWLAYAAANWICQQCHYADPPPPGSAISPSVLNRFLPAQIPTAWFRHARFDHRAHRHVECRTCHAAAYDFEKHNQPQVISLLTVLRSGNPRNALSASVVESEPLNRSLHLPEGYTQARDDSEVMIAGLDTCVTCHSPRQSGRGGARFDCAECHDYHGRDSNALERTASTGFSSLFSLHASTPPTHDTSSQPSNRRRGTRTPIGGEPLLTGHTWNRELLPTVDFRHSTSASQPLLTPVSLAPSPPAYVGASSCAGAGCHGDARRDAPRWRSAFAEWLACDSHVHAYNVLWTFRAREMTRLLSQREALPLPLGEGRGEGGRNASRSLDPRPNPLPKGEGTIALRPPDALPDADHLRVLQVRCLNCHATPAPLETELTADSHAYGVSCESCHGPAGNWLHTHARASFSRDIAGFIDTKDLAARAAACLPCHVGPHGSPHAPREGSVSRSEMTTMAPRESDISRSEMTTMAQAVDHDLIAAGHPRLSFDFATYFQSLPAHWDRKEDEARHAPAYHYRSWVAGETQQQGWLREQFQATGQAGWPDFALLDCSACHHALRPADWSPPFSQFSPPASEHFALSLLPKRPPPPPAGLSAHSRLDWARGLADQLSKPGIRHSEAVSCYLALRAVAADFSAESPPPAETQLAELTAALNGVGRYLASDSFPSAAAAGAAPTPYDSPAGFTPRDLAQRTVPLQRALQHLQAIYPP